MGANQHYVGRGYGKLLLDYATLAHSLRGFLVFFDDVNTFYQHLVFRVENMLNSPLLSSVSSLDYEYVVV